MGTVGSLIKDDAVAVLGRQEYWVNVVAGEVKDTVLVGLCGCGHTLLERQGEERGRELEGKPSSARPEDICLDDKAENKVKWVR